MTFDKTRSRIFLGAACVLAGALMFALSGVAIKIAAGSLSSESIVFWRNVISVMILAPWAVRGRERWFRPDNMKLIGVRAGTIVLSLYCYYYAVSVIPLADAVLLISSSPIFVPLLGYLFFRFALDRRVLMAVLVGFLGVSLILQPSAGEFNFGALLGLMAGIFGAVGVVIMWKMPPREDPGRIVFFLALFSVIVSAIPAAVSGQWPSGSDWWALLALGVFSTLAHLLFAYACLIAPADRIITLEYATVIFASVLGWIIWGERPGLLFIVGGTLIIGAAVHVVRSHAKSPPPRAPRRTAHPLSAPSARRGFPGSPSRASYH